MSFKQSLAQEFIVVDPSMDHNMDNKMSLVPLEVEDIHSDYPAVVESIEAHDDPIELEITMELPGAPPGTKDPEPVIEVSEHDKDDDKNKAVDEDPAKTKLTEKWDWSKRGADGFIVWVKERLNDVPKHSGYDTAGLDRACAYLERLDNEVSKAMRADTDGQLDANQVEKVRSIIEDGLEKLHDRNDKVKSSKKKSRKKKSEIIHDSLVKEAQKITGVQGIFVTVPLLISRIARVCINGMVSGGHDIEQTFKDQVKKYSLNNREQAEVMQLLSDMGYAVKQDRGYMPDEDVDTTSSDNYDWAGNFPG